jgi:hypothetical protein
MSGPAQLAGFGLGGCFEVFKVRAFRLETLSTYAVPAEEGLRAFRLGLPRPERPVRTSSWLRRIADTTAAGKSWRRVRVLGRPSFPSLARFLQGGLTLLGGQGGQGHQNPLSLTVTLRHTIRHATGNPAGALPGAAVHAKDPDAPGATRAPMPLQHPDQYRWPDYTYLVATR